MTLVDEVFALAPDGDFVVVRVTLVDAAESRRNASSSVSAFVVTTTVRSGQCRLTRRDGRIDVHHAAMIDDRDAIAQPLRLFHQMRRQEHGLAAGADAAHQIPDCPARLRVQPGRQLVEEHDARDR